MAIHYSIEQKNGMIEAVASGQDENMAEVQEYGLSILQAANPGDYRHLRLREIHCRECYGHRPGGYRDARRADPRNAILGDGGEESRPASQYLFRCGSGTELAGGMIISLLHAQ